jgi:polyisoprenoid-binding protein YceI
MEPQLPASREVIAVPIPRRRHGCSTGRCRGLAGIVAAVLLVGPAAASAAPLAYRVDTAHSRIDFHIRYLALFSSGGHFNAVTGTVFFDPEHWDTLAASVWVRVDSLETWPRFWRAELTGPKFLDGAHHPIIEFNVTRTTRTGRATAEASGSLTLRGLTRPIALKARIVPEAGALGIDAETTLQRSAFDLDAALPLASDDVTVVLHLRIAPAPAVP